MTAKNSRAPRSGTNLAETVATAERLCADADAAREQSAHLIARARRLVAAGRRRRTL